MTPIYTIAAISLGASLGALARYGLGLALNAIFPPLPIGTLAANLIAAYVVGVTIAYVGTVPGLSPLWRLFMITGLAGGCPRSPPLLPSCFRCCVKEGLGCRPACSACTSAARSRC